MPIITISFIYKRHKEQDDTRSNAIHKESVNCISSLA